MIVRHIFLACLILISANIFGCSAVSSIFKNEKNNSPVSYQVAPRTIVNMTLNSKELEFNQVAKGGSVKEIIYFTIATDMNIENITLEETKKLMDKNNGVLQSVTRSFVPPSNYVKSAYYFELKNKHALCNEYYLLTEYVIYKEIKLSVRSDLRPSYCPKSEQP